MAFIRPTTTAPSSSAAAAPPTAPPTPPAPAVGATRQSHTARRELPGNADLRNLALLLLGFVCVLALVPPARAYPMDDDWTYFQSVSGLLHWAYKPHEWSQTIALGHLAWGALFSAIL